MRAESSLVNAWFKVQQLSSMRHDVVAYNASSSTLQANLDVRSWAQNYCGGADDSQCLVGYLEEGLQRLMALTSASVNAQHLLMAALYGRTNLHEILELQSAIAFHGQVAAQSNAAYDSVAQRLMALYPVSEDASNGSGRTLQ